MQANRDLWADVTGRRRVADAFVQMLGPLGADPVFAMPAESLNPIVDGLRRTGRHRLVVVRNEAAGALMASAYAKLTGRVGVCLGTAGPGATHLPLGTYDASADRAPMLAVAGQVPLEHVGSGYFQEIDSARLFADSCAYVGTVHAPGQARVMATAAAQALRRRAGVHLTVTVDALTGRAPRAFRPPVPRWLTPGAVDDKDSLAGVAQLVESGECVLLVGRVDDDVSDAAEQLAMRLSAAVLVLPEGYGYFRRPRSHPAFRAGPASEEEARSLLASADTAIVVGPLTASVTRLLPPGGGTSTVQIAALDEVGTPRQSRITRLVGDQADLLRLLVEAVPRGGRGQALRAAEAVRWEPAAGSRLRSAWQELDGALPDNAVLAVEPGLALESAFHWLPVRDRVMTSSFGLSTHGYAVPGAIAAAYAHPDRPVYAVATPEGLNETMAELQTIQRHDLPVKILCLAGHGTGIDRIALAGACRIPARQASAGEVAEASRQPGAVLVDVLLDEPGPSTTAVRDRPADAPYALGDVLGDALVAAGATHVYACVRPQLAPLVAGWRHRLDVTPVTQAESAAMMASALGKLSAVPGVCLTGTASDLVLQLNGLYDAAFDGSPVLVVNVEDPGDVVNPAVLLGEIVRETVRLKPGPDAFQAICRAVRMAAEQRGVVHLAVARGDLDRPCPRPPELHDGPSNDDRTAPGERIVPAQQLLEQAVELLHRARRPAILVGRGARDARQEIEQLAELLGAPVLTTMPGRGVVPDHHPAVVGAIGSSGHPAAMQVLKRCDVLLVLGVSNRGAAFDLPGRFTVIRVDREPLQLLADRPGVGLYGTSREVLQRVLVALPPGRARPRWYGRVGRRPWYTLFPRTLRANGVPPSLVARTIGSALSGTGERGLVTTDVGLVTLWVFRYLSGPHTTVWSGSFATMGFALPAGIVAGQRFPGRPVVAACGDGGVSVTMAELATAGRLKSPLTVVVFNNGKLGAIKYEQQVMGWPEYGSRLWNCDYRAFAEACSVTGIRVERPEQLAAALTEAVSADRPYLVDVVCDPDELPVPAQGPHPRQVAGVLVTFVRELWRKVR